MRALTVEELHLFQQQRIRVVSAAAAGAAIGWIGSFC